ncbi:hypothetical protein JCM5350_003768 [Sporobolomyces pararoseus]
MSYMSQYEDWNALRRWPYEWDRRKDKFSELPTELVDQIFALAHDEYDLLLGPLNKQTLDSFRFRLYSEVRIWNYKQLKSFCRASIINPSLMTLVQSLKIDIEQFEIAPFRDWRAEVFDPKEPTDDEISRLFHTIPFLRSLTVIGSSRIARILLEIPPSFPFAFCSTLRSLDLTSLFDDSPDPIQLLALAPLDVFRSLESLNFIFPRDESSIEELPVEPFRPALPSSLTTLKLEGNICSSSYCSQVIESIPPVITLALHDEDDESFVFHLLRRVPHPLSVTELSIIPVYDEASYQEPEILRGLLRFSNLESLMIDVWDEPEFYRIIAQLPLKRLLLAPRHEDSVEELVKLMSGPTKMKTLVEFCLRHYPVKAGRAIREIEGDLKEHPTQLRPESYGWSLPKWTRGITREGFKRLMLVVEEENVKLSSTLVGSLEVESQWLSEVERYTRKYEEKFGRL